jgi:hypothetical protein
MNYPSLMILFVEVILPLSAGRRKDLEAAGGEVAGCED